ncbi:ATP-binding cassette domain-containing protein [Limnohabitans sp.]|jgi:ABC-type sugar transport system ATPase subunit|uniref:ATP-binding cassette domain-containing protein n=1 Tax=Limnohabitans sp. TaxID=1907725 RepID=UPI0025CF4927|nr:ATP-binding cassette domain-containing protein [Limnohabitans sp.]
MPQRRLPTDFIASLFTPQDFTVARIELKKIVKQWGDAVGVKRMSLDIADGEFLMLLGPSGSGKTTTMRMEARLENSTSGDESMGIAPASQKLTMRSLDFWRCESSLIRENWFLVDWLNVYKQIGVGVLARMREFNKARFFQNFQGSA